VRRIDELHLQHPFMGARMLRDQLNRQGIEVGRRHVRTQLRTGMEALAPQPGTSKRAPGHKVYPYLLRNLAITRSNQVWALDTTNIPDGTGVRLSHRSGGSGQLQGAGAQSDNHVGGQSCEGGDRAGVC